MVWITGIILQNMDGKYNSVCDVGEARCAHFYLSSSHKNATLGLTAVSRIGHNMSNHQLQLMAAISSKIASFFNLLSDKCMSELNRNEKPAELTNNQLETSFHRQENISPLHIPERSMAIASKPEVQVDRFLDELICDEANIGKESQQSKPKKGRPKTNPKSKILSHKPKAPTSSYLLFFHENKQEIAAKWNVTSNGDVARMASIQWRRLQETDKAKYIQRSTQEKTRYREAMELYRLNYADEIEEMRSRKKRQTEELKRNRNIKDMVAHHQVIKGKKSSSGSSSNSSSSSSSSSLKPPAKHNKTTHSVIEIESSLSNSSTKKDQVQI